MLQNLTKQAEEPSVIPQKKTRLANISTFSFQQHRIFCGEDCNLDYLCRKIEPKRDNKSLKQSLLDNNNNNNTDICIAPYGHNFRGDICDCRDDDWLSTVRLRNQGAISDLHAADARYHVTCQCSFRQQPSWIWPLYSKRSRVTRCHLATRCHPADSHYTGCANKKQFLRKNSLSQLL